MKKYFLLLLFLPLVLIYACSKNSNGVTNGIKYVPISFQFSVNDPVYSKLGFSGNWMYLDGYGVKGLILSNVGGVIYALERDCPYNPNDTCALCTVLTGNTMISCGRYNTKKVWVPCCNSSFLLDGTLQKGPAVYSMKKYNVTQPDPSTGIVTITN